MSGSPQVLLVFDDGGGPALYAGGFFTGYAARLVGERWVPLGTLDGAVLTLAAFDDGSGPALYAGGFFEHADGRRVRGIARWDGQSWSPLGPVISAGSPTIRSLVVHDDGTGGGPALYVAGNFLRLADGTLSENVGRWTKHGWAAVSSGLEGRSLAELTVFDDRLGDGPQLYGIESYVTPAGTGRGRIVRWDGTSWSILEDDFGTSANRLLSSLEVFADPRTSGPMGSPPALYVAGSFAEVADVPANNVARWDGRSWSALGPGPGTEVNQLAVVDGALYAGGTFGRVRRWDGGRWIELAPMLIDTAVTALTGCRSPGGPVLFAGSSPDDFNSAECYFSMWDGVRWSTPGIWLNGSVRALATFDDGSSGGPALFAGGTFSVAGGVSARAVAKWDGSAWSSLERGMQGQYFRTSVEALIVHDDGSGPALFAGGEFVEAGGHRASNVARWNGTRWAALGAGLDQIVLSLALFDDGLGGGPALHAGGLFTASGSNPVARIARWDGSSWMPLGSGLDNDVQVLAVHDEGTGAGPVLFVGGSFTNAGGTPVRRIARWNGAQWTPVGSGTDGFNDVVASLCTFDDGLGGGPALYAAGRFTSAGSLPANRIARWDGASWSPLGSGLNSIALALAVFDDGTGPALYAAGLFTMAGGRPASRLARWDGVSWTTLGSGLDASFSTGESLAAFEAPFAAPSLVVGGAFLSAGGMGDSYLGRWQGCPAVPAEARGPRTDLAPPRPWR